MIVRVVALVESPGHVCCRYRLAAFAPHLTDAGYALELLALPRSPFARLRLYPSLRSADAVILQRRLLPVAEVGLLRRAARKLIFDFDDAVWMRDSYSPKGFDSHRRARRFGAVVAAADAVAAGNSYLAEHAGQFARPGAVAVIPTCVDPAAYPIARHHAAAPAGPVRLVWVGSHSTLQGLDRFRDTLETLGRDIPGLRLKLVCDRFLSFDRLPVDPVPWSGETEALEIATSDIGIAWTPDDPWSQGKCGLKVLQYQAAGLPVVANPVGVHPLMVRGGVTGFVADEPREWVEAIRALAEEPSLRRNLGAHGRAAVEAHYSTGVGGRLWVELLDGLIRGNERRSNPTGFGTGEAA